MRIGGTFELDAWQSSYFSNFLKLIFFLGDEFSPNFFLEDIYDGEESEDDGTLKNGLGLLTDGLFGESVSLMDTRSNPPSAHGWVGWANRDGKPPVTLIFEFKTVREFDHVIMTSFSMLPSGIQPFTQVDVFFIFIKALMQKL